jgi:hypothetical protein
MAGKAFFLMRLNDHVQYLKKIENTLADKGDFQGTCHTECKLGKWIYGEGAQEIAALNDADKGKALFDAIKDPHEQFHIASKQAVEKKKAGDAEGAKAASTQMHVLSNDICTKLLDLDKLS